MVFGDGLFIYMPVWYAGGYRKSSFPSLEGEIACLLEKQVSTCPLMFGMLSDAYLTIHSMQILLSITGVTNLHVIKNVDEIGCISCAHQITPKGASVT